MTPDEITALIQAVASGYDTLGWFGALSAAIYASVKVLRYVAPNFWVALKPWAKAALVFAATFLGALLATAGGLMLAGGTLGAALVGGLVPALVAAIPAALGAMGIRAIEKTVVAKRLGVTDKQSLKVPINMP